MPHVLVVDDDASTLTSLRTLLEAEHYRVTVAINAVETLRELHRRGMPDVIVLDLVMPGNEGLELLQRLRQTAPSAKIIMSAGVNHTTEIVQAIKLGAVDYIAKPINPAELLASVTLHAGAPSIPEMKPERHREIVEDLDENNFFLAASPAMFKVYDQIRRIAEVDVPVLVTGESGTGKEIASLLIHKLCSRAQRKFLKVNCAAIPEDLLESELFGFEAGAFTGATHAKPGHFELGDRGVVFLDEIGEMPPRLQAKLLQVLQEQKFFRLGSKSPVSVNVRILAATNVNIEDAIRAGKLRLDLYYRLNAFNLALPPLRERREEIAPLFRHYMRRLALAYKLAPRPLTDSLLRACMQHAWPGNLRELHNFVKRYLVLGDESGLAAELRAQPSVAERAAAARAHSTGGVDLKHMVRGIKEEAEAEAIANALEQTNWNRRKAAAMLNISYKALIYKSRQYGILLPKSRTPRVDAVTPEVQ